jgi:hypothetical protein
VSRDYLKCRGQVVAVEVDPSVEIADVERELRRVYGAAYRLGRWSRRGKRWRAEVVRDDEKTNNFGIIGLLDETPSWFGAP